MSYACNIICWWLASCSTSWKDYLGHRDSWLSPFRSFGGQQIMISLLRIPRILRSGLIVSFLLKPKLQVYVSKWLKLVNFGELHNWNYDREEFKQKHSQNSQTMCSYMTQVILTAKLLLRNFYRLSRVLPTKISWQLLVTGWSNV